MIALKHARSQGEKVFLFLLLLIVTSVLASAQQSAPSAPPSASTTPFPSPPANQTPQPGVASPIFGAPPGPSSAPATSPGASPFALPQSSAPANPMQTTAPGASPTTPPGTTTGTTPAASGAPAPASTSAGSAASTSAVGQSGIGNPVASASSVVALSDALQRANVGDANYASALTTSGIAVADRAIARAALLPNVVYHNQYLYTQGSGIIRGAISNPGVLATPRFIANNAVHEYVSQGVVNELFSAAGVDAYRRAGAGVDLAKANLEVSRRALVVAIATSYYTLLASDKKLTVAEHSQAEADSFVNLSEKLEMGGEVAHADVIKAQLQQQVRQRNRVDAQLADEKARLDLGIFLFPDPRSAYTLAESQSVTLPPLPTYENVQAAAQKGNPELRAAAAALRVAQFDLSGARAAYLPDLGLNYSYGIDAAQFATRAPDGTHNLGYSAFATVDIPVFDWFATASRVKQGNLRLKLAQLELTTAQRRAIADLEEFYHEAQGAANELQLLDRSVTLSAESLRLTYLRYSDGEATALEVVDAQNSATDAESLRADGIVRYRVALANLQTLTGTLPQ